MPRINRLHFSSLGHRDARFPALTLDLRDRGGRAADTVLWAENSTGKTSLLSLFFSTFQPRQTRFLGKQAEGKARELGDYVRSRDLAFIVTEWDTTDDRAEASLLEDIPRELLLVGQALSWKGLDSANELRRLFFTLRPNRGVNFDTLPVLGLGEPAASFEAFRDWLDEQNRAYPKLEVRHTQNQSEWREHLENNHLDPELFTYQLRMNESEGGINNLFNDLKSDRDFIRLFLQLGFDPAKPNQVRANLEEFLPKLRRRDVLDLQLEFNGKLLVDLGLFLKQLGLWEEAKARGAEAEHATGSLLAALRAAKERFDAEASRLAQGKLEAEAENKRLTSERDGTRRRQNFFTRLKYELEEKEAKTELERCQTACQSAQSNKRLVEMAGLLGEIGVLQIQAAELERAIAREQEQAKPVLEMLRALGARYKFRVQAEVEIAQARIEETEGQRRQLQETVGKLGRERLAVTAEQAAKEQESATLGNFFTERESLRERLRREGMLETKEAAADAAQRWQGIGTKASEAITRAVLERDSAQNEKDALAAQASRLATEIAETDHVQQQLAKTIQRAEAEAERIATHLHMRAAVETSRADLNLPQTMERLAERGATLFRRILRLNLEGAEDQRAQDYIEKRRLFPPPRDVEALVESLRAAGVATATTAAQWLAFNVADRQAAAELLASDPALYGGVMFDGATEASQLTQAIGLLSTDQVPVQLSPLPDSQPSPNGAGRPVVLPRHAGGFNFNEAQEQSQKLAGLMATRKTELEQLATELNETRQLASELERWLTEFGGSKLGTLRERLRGEQQSLESLCQRQQKNAARQQELTASIASAMKAVDEQQQALAKATRAVAQLENFVERFDADYEAKRAKQDALGARLQELSVELPVLEERRRTIEAGEKPIQQRQVELGIALTDLSREASKIAYVGTLPESVEESLEQLRAWYDAELRRYQGRFLNTAAQGELATKQESIREKTNRLNSEFVGLERKTAEAKLLAGDLPRQKQLAEEALEQAQKHAGAAERNLDEARKRLKELGAPAEQERPGQGELIPATAHDTAAILAKLVTEYEKLQEQLDANRSEGEALMQAHTRFTQRSANYENHAIRLADQNPPQDVPASELPEDDVRVASLVDERLKNLKQNRDETAAEQGKLRSHFDAIQELTQEDAYARATDLPARSLFAHMPLDELIACAATKRVAVEEDTTTLRADLEQMNAHRETIVESLLNVSEQAIRLLERAERWSRMPETMTGWENEPFLRIRLHSPPGRQDNIARLKSLMDLLLEEGKIPGGIELVFRALLALVGETGVDATILKPEAQRRNTRYPVREMSSWSEGERTTVAILLYCTLVKIRAQSRGHVGRRAEVSALLLDNPVGPCSKREFLELHRWIAGQLGVQLIYATGVNDPQALSVFPNRIRLAKNRIVPETGELAVGLVREEGESAISEIRIFDGMNERA